MSIDTNIFKTLDAYRQRTFHSDRRWIGGFQEAEGKAKREETFRNGVLVHHLNCGDLSLSLSLSFSLSLHIYIYTHTHIHTHSVWQKEHLLECGWQVILWV